MKKSDVSLIVLVVIAVSSVSKGATLYIDDGLTHTFNSHSWNRYWIDYYIANAPGTHVELVDDGSVESFSLYNNATATITGGEIRSSIFANDNSTASVSGGTIMFTIWAADSSTITVTDGMHGGLSAQQYGKVTMSGGSVDYVGANHNSIINVSGGTIEGQLRTWVDGIIYLEGTNFVVTDIFGNTTNLTYGDRLSNYVTLDANNEVFVGTIAGTLADGSALECDFGVWNGGAEYPQATGIGDIYIIPEPATLLLLGMGMLLIQKRDQ
jgi:hypothetical protein